MKDWKKHLPSAEHRGHIRRFQGLDWMTDEEDVALRGYVIWKRLNARLMGLTGGQKPSTKKRGGTGTKPARGHVGNVQTVVDALARHGVEIGDDLIRLLPKPKRR